MTELKREIRSIVIITIISLISVALLVIRDSKKPDFSELEPSLWYYAEGVKDFEFIIAISQNLDELTSFFKNNYSFCPVYRIKENYHLVKGRMFLLILFDRKEIIPLTNALTVLKPTGQFIQQDSVYWVKKTLEGFYPLGKNSDFKSISL